MVVSLFDKPIAIPDQSWNINLQQTKIHSRLNTGTHGKFITLSRWKTWLKKKLRPFPSWRPKVMGSFLPFPGGRLGSRRNWDPFQVEDRNSWEVCYLFQVEDLFKKETETRSRLKTGSHGKFVNSSNHVMAFIYDSTLYPDPVYYLQLWVGSNYFFDYLLKVYPPVSSVFFPCCVFLSGVFRCHFLSLLRVVVLWFAP